MRAMDADTLLIRRTARRVGLWLTLAVSSLVVIVLIAAFAFIFRQIPFSSLFDRHRHGEMIDVGGLDVIVGGFVIGILAVLLAGTLGLIATRRAVAPLVDALSRQRRFVADASHELRTPLAILDSRLQLLERSLTPHDPNRRVVAELRGDSQNVISVVVDLLDSMEPDSDHVDQSVTIAPIIEAAVASMHMLSAERGVAVLARSIPADVTARISDPALHRVVVALIDNAIKHSPTGEHIVVRTARDRGWVELSVTDHGPGIRGIDPKRVFDRFARSSDAVDGGGTARTGFGIGLSLVQDTVSRFGGSVSVTDTSGSGTTITVRLRVARARVPQRS